MTVIDASPTTHTECAREGPALPVCDEFPVQLDLNGERIVTLLCTPADLTELALGWLYCEGMIDSLDEVQAVGGCEESSRVAVFSDASKPVAQSEWRRVITSGCGSGHAIDPAELAKLPPVRSDYAIPLARLEERMRQVALGGPIKRTIGGVHSAALIDDTSIVAHFEDVGRHNAVDKCIGRALLRGTDFSRTALLATGRISSEMAFKASRAGIPIVASLNSTTGLAVHIAEQVRVTIVAKAIGRKRVIYTWPERILGLDPADVGNGA